MSQPLRKKALFVVDVQPDTLSAGAKDLVRSIAGFIGATNYDAYVEATWHADEDSMFFKQEGFSLPAEKAGKTAPEILDVLAQKKRPCLSVSKNVRSCFYAFNAARLESFLKENAIEEIHLLGFDINDCVLASAYGAIDRGYYTYVIEDLCHHHDISEGLKEAALAVLREQGMTKTSGEYR